MAEAAPAAAAPVAAPPPAAPPAAAPPAAAAPAAAPAAAAPAAASPAAAPKSEAPVSLIGDLPKKEEAPAAKPDPEKAATEEIKANYKATVADVKVELPEGVVVDPQVLSDVKALALEELTPSQRAQKTLELGLRQLQSFQSEAKSAFKQAVDGWREATMADKEIGGAKFPEAQKLANKAIAALGGQPLADILRQSGLANHPAVVKAFARAGTTVIEDTVAGTLQSPVPNAGPQTQADQAAALGYGKMSSELRARRK